MQLITILWFA